MPCAAGLVGGSNAPFLVKYDTAYCFSVFPYLFPYLFTGYPYLFGLALKNRCPVLGALD